MHVTGRRWTEKRNRVVTLAYQSTNNQMAAHHVANLRHRTRPQPRPLARHPTFAFETSSTMRILSSSSSHAPASHARATTTHLLRNGKLEETDKKWCARTCNSWKVNLPHRREHLSVHSHSYRGAASFQLLRFLSLGLTLRVDIWYHSYYYKPFS